METQATNAPAAKVRKPDFAKPRAAIEPELLDRIQVMSLCSISGNLLDSLVEQGALPRPIRLARRAVRWRRSSLLEAIERLGADAEATAQ